MPVQWPGNTATKLARAATGGGFESAIDGLPQDGNFPAANLLVDDFSTGDLSTTDADGFVWGDMWSTSLVTMSPAGNPTVIYNGSPIYNEVLGDPRDWTAKVGDNCMRVRYGAGVEMAQQTFWLGQNYSEIWMRYWVRVPETYFLNHTTGNNKLLILFMDKYNSIEGGKIVVSMEPSASGVTNIEIIYETGGDALNVRNRSNTPTPFIDGNTDRLRWMQLVLHAKTSSPGVADGFAKIYRRWEDESTFTLMDEVTNEFFRVPPDGLDQGWGGGYIFSAHNQAFSVDTEYLVDKVEFSTEALI